jgi:hypothetical protein
VRSSVVSRFLVSAAFAAVAPPAADAASLAYVYDYTGPASSYVVERDGRTVTLTPLLPLAPGDRVSVKAAGGATGSGAKAFIALAIARQTVTLYAGSPPYCVGAPGGDCNKRVAAVTATAPSGVNYLGNILTYLGSVLVGPHDDKYADQTESMLSRGIASAPPIEFPLLSSEGRRLVAGSRALALEWRGGTPPFDVSLYRDGVASALVTRRLETRATVLPSVAFEAGTYHIEIVDAEKQSGLGRFTVVSEDAVPRPTPDEQTALGDPALSPDLRTTLEAALLTRRDHTWDFEAYQRVEPLAATCPAAELLRYRIADDQ